jgi:cytochrome c5
MKKLITIVMISMVVFACSHKTRSSVTKTETNVSRTSSSTVSNAQYLEGKVLYEAKCGTCHKLKDPARGNMTQWTKWIDRMAPKAKLSEEEKQMVTNYVSVNALVN